MLIFNILDLFHNFGVQNSLEAIRLGQESGLLS